MANSVFIWPGMFAFNGSTVNFTNPISVPAGAANAPSIAFSQTDPDFGFYAVADDDIGVSIGGVLVWDWTATTATCTGNIVALGTAGFQAAAAAFFFWSGRSNISSPANGKIRFTPTADTTGILWDFATDGVAKLRGQAGTAGTGNLDIGATVSAYNNVSTAGWGVPAIQAQARTVGAVAAVASVAAYTVGAADGSFEISCNVLVTTSTTHTFTVTCAYTDESNTGRVLTLNVSQITGTFVTAITNITGAGAYEGVPMHIRCKAATTITIATAAGGTYTSVVYNVEGMIKQVA